MIIVIDGPAGTGKSTVAQKVAQKLGFTFFDTGAMYRSIAWMLLQEKVDPANREEVCRLLPRFKYEIKIDEKSQRRYFVSGTDVTAAIREPTMSSAASKIATIPELREMLVKIQRKFGHHCNAVFEGRDMGTVVFPDADLKIFLTAKPEVRARRRFEELLKKFPDMNQTLEYGQILKEIEERDRNDSTRAISPLKQAPDAHLIDTSDMNVDDVVDQILGLLPQHKSYFRKKWIYGFSYWVARIFFKACFRLKIYGLEHFRPGAGIVASNHASLYDPPVLSVSCPEEVHFLARETLFKNRFFGGLIRNLNTHPVSGDAGDIGVMKTIISLLEQGKKVVLFPEGTRSKDGELKPLKAGISMLVSRTKTAIIPVYIDGAYQAWNRSQKFPRLFGKVSCVFGTPITWESFSHLDRKEAQKQIAEKLTDSILGLKQWLKDGAKGVPP